MTYLYNENENNNNHIIPELTEFPAHIIKLTKKQINNQIVFNLIAKIDQSAGEMSLKTYKIIDGELIPFLDENNKQIVMTGDFFVGREIRSIGFWLGQREAGEHWKNKAYKNMIENFVDLPKRQKDGIIYLELIDIEEEDVIGKPIIIKLITEKYEKDGKNYLTLKFKDMRPWAKGKEINVEEEKEKEIRQQEEQDLEDFPF